MRPNYVKNWFFRISFEFTRAFFCLNKAYLFVSTNVLLFKSIKRYSEQCTNSWTYNCCCCCRCRCRCCCGCCCYEHTSDSFHISIIYQWLWWISLYDQLQSIRTHISALLLSLDLITCAELLYSMHFSMDIYIYYTYITKYHVTLVVVEMYLGATSCLSVSSYALVVIYGWDFCFFTFIQPSNQRHCETFIEATENSFEYRADAVQAHVTIEIHWKMHYSGTLTMWQS